MLDRRLAVAVIVFAFAANTQAEISNPAAPSSVAPAAVAAESPKKIDPTTDQGIRKLSRRERKDRISKLAERYQQFLREVEPIMMVTELNTFLVLESDAQRDRFVDEFWTRRSPDPITNAYGFRDTYQDRIGEARSRFKNLLNDRAKIYLIHGQPDDVVAIDCTRAVQPMELWSYSNLAGFGRESILLFYQPRNGVDYKLFQPIGRPNEDLAELLSMDGQAEGVEKIFFGATLEGIRMIPNLEYYCAKDADLIRKGIGVAQMRRLDMHRLFNPPKVDEEDVGKMLRTAVIANANAPKFPAEFAVTFPGKRGGRTATELTITVPTAQLKANEVDALKVYNLDISGEVLKDGKLFETYRYRFDFPVASAKDKLPVVIERFLRPATYQSRIKVVDVNSGAEAILENPLEVPYFKEEEGKQQLDQQATETISRIQEEVRTGEARVRIVPMPNDLLTGYQHIETLVVGPQIKAVEFYLDGKKVMTKRQPPYTLDLDFGNVPQPHKVRVVGIDEKSNVVAGDEIVLNTGLDPFRVRIVSPRVAVKVTGRVRVEVEVEVPENKSLEGVDLYLNETKLATLYERPFIQTINVPDNLGIGYLRAVARLKDDPAPPVEDVVFINTPEHMEEVDVHLVELPTTVLRDGRPVLDLPSESFQVLDEGKTVKVEKFEYVKNLPLSIGLAVDSSGSMRNRMVEAQKAGAEFFKNVLKPGDKAFVVSFDERPNMVQKWSRQLSDLNAGIAAMRAEDTTALFDAIVLSLYNFHGIKGQKALVVISDGKDTASSFTFDQTLEYARRAAVPIYIIGIGIRTAEVDTRYRLNRFSAETGGNLYYIEKAEDLGKIYGDIQNELRSQYLLGFYPPAGVKPGSKWRDVKVEVKGGNAKTIRGYYP